jgi:beta-galactosidase
MVDAAGRRQAHGTRAHACWNADSYLLRVTRIVNELGRRYGKDARVWGWQLDNELAHYGKEPCFCNYCQHEFQAWLEKKYGTIAALNRDWGNSFWSQMYQRFDQIRLPNPQEYPAQFNPHHMLDSQRWFADDIADYMRFQTEILRKYCGHNQWITTNHIHNFSAVNPALTARDFDVVTWTLYPVHGNANEGPLGFRLGSSATLTFAADFMRALNGQAGIMELQPAPTASRPPPAANNTPRPPAKSPRSALSRNRAPRSRPPTPPAAPRCSTATTSAGISITTSKTKPGTPTAIS